MTTHPPAESDRQLPAGNSTVETTAPTSGEGGASSAPVLRLGRYRIGDEIGRGGMGAVLRGHDDDLRRDVAVKVLLDDHADNPDLLNRFVEEAQIAGQLQHPGVVPIYELGRLEARPYFAMKLVRGRTLAELLQERSDLRQDLPRFLAIFEQVCQAVAFAHSKRVIHRDLKPANVMVGSFGEVHVMDWGLAKVVGTITEATAPAPAPAVSVIRTVRSGPSAEAGEATSPVGLWTEAGSVLGTPAYMAPEQAMGEVQQMDERTDVFGLGAILCEVLTGKPPYVAAERRRVLCMAAMGELTEAQARLEGSGADAEVVALASACLAPQRDDRPRDAGEVARRVADYQRGVQERLRWAERERAAAEARVEEARATARAQMQARHRTLALAAVVLLAVGVGGGAVAWYQQEKAARRAGAESGAEAAVREAEVLLRLRQEQERDPERWHATVSLAEAEVQRAEGLLSTAAVRRDLQDRVNGLRGEVDRERRDSGLRLELDRIRMEKTAIKEGHFDEAAAAPLYRAALGRYGIDLAAPAAAAAVVRSSLLRNSLQAALADWWKVTGDKAEKEALAKVLTAAEPDADSFRSRWQAAARQSKGPKLALLAKEPVAADLPPADLVNLAADLQRLGEVAAAVQLLAVAVERYPGDFWALHDLGMVLREARPPEPLESVRYLTAAVALRSQSPGAHLHLGNALYEKGDVAGAIRCYKKARDLDQNYPMAHNNLGAALQARGQLDEALRCFRKALELDPGLPIGHNNLGNALQARGQSDQAVRCYRRAIELEPKYAMAHCNLGNAMSARNENAEAIRWYHKAIELDPQLAVAHGALGAALHATGDLEGAVRCCRRAIELDPALALAHGTLSRALLARGEFAPGRQAAQQALDLLQPQHPLRNLLTHVLRGCEAGVALEKKLAAILRGEARPADAAEALALAHLCQRFKEMPAASARFFTEAFTIDKKLAEDLQSVERYNAACAAALAAAGQGKDAGKLDLQERRQWRKQAFVWLRAELDAHKDHLAAAKPEEQKALHKFLQDWQNDTDFAGVQGPKALAALPADEREAWKKLWEDHAALIDKTRPSR